MQFKRFVYSVMRILESIALQYIQVNVQLIQTVASILGLPSTLFLRVNQLRLMRGL